MDQVNQQVSPSTSPRARAAAFSVHIFTAMGAGVALIALLEAVREHWAAMFAWLGLALVIDALDGPIARRLDVARVQPDWSGDVLDLVVDFVTYVFVPAYAITASGLLLPVAAPILGAGIVVSAALYFADRRMKTEDNHFRGFPALWNAAAFYLFLLHLSPALSSLAVAVVQRGAGNFKPGVQRQHHAEGRRTGGGSRGRVAFRAAQPERDSRTGIGPGTEPGDDQQQQGK